MNGLINIFFTKIEEIFSKETLPSKLAVAVSGGIDSLALTLLLDEFCKKKKIKLFAVTIDHKIRDSSSKEALDLGEILSSRKIFHKILTLSQEKIPQKNIEAKLREARYDLLCEFCRKNKIEFLFVGHHLGDIAENFLIRLFRGSGLDGLSTIAEISEAKEIKIVRPLLDFEKDQLKSFLESKKVKWFEDETNEDEKFLRNKIRKFFESFEEKNLIQKRIKRACDEISQMRDFIDAILLDEAKNCLEFDGKKFLIEVNKFRKINQKVALKILAFILMEIGEKNYKPRLEKLKNFYNHLIQETAVKPRNFYGCIVKKFDKERLMIFPEKEKNSKIILKTILKNIF